MSHAGLNVVTGDDFGLVKLFDFPCTEKFVSDLVLLCKHTTSPHTQPVFDSSSSDRIVSSHLSFLSIMFGRVEPVVIPGCESFFLSAGQTQALPRPLGSCDQHPLLPRRQARDQHRRRRLQVSGLCAPLVVTLFLTFRPAAPSALTEDVDLCL